MRQEVLVWQVFNGGTVNVKDNAIFTINNLVSQFIVDATHACIVHSLAIRRTACIALRSLSQEQLRSVERYTISVVFSVGCTVM